MLTENNKPGIEENILISFVLGKKKSQTDQPNKTIISITVREPQRPICTLEDLPEEISKQLSWKRQYCNQALGIAVLVHPLQ